MRILILGGDGYLGWPCSMYFSKRDHDVMIVDNFSKRAIENELGTRSLTPIFSLQNRIDTWKEVTGKTIQFQYGDICNYDFLSSVF